MPNEIKRIILDAINNYEADYQNWVVSYAQHMEYKNDIQKVRDYLSLLVDEDKAKLAKEEEMINPDLYLQYSCEHNRVNAPDGEYLLKDRNGDWSEDSKDKPFTQKDYFSKSKVIVRGGLVDIATLEHCYREIQYQHNYHGSFIEDVGFDGKYITIGMGS